MAINAYTWTTATFVVPVIGLNVNIAVEQAAWMGNGQILFIEFAGYYEVQSVPTSTSVIVKNLGYDGNTSAGLTIPSQVNVAPGGIKGDDGSQTGTAGGSLEGSFPDPTVAITTTKGDLIVNQNGTTAPRNTRLSAGTDGAVLHSDSTQATGLQHRNIDLTGVSTGLDGVLPVAKGGTGAATDALARAALSAAGSGPNSDITSLTGLTTPLSVAQGGTAGATAATGRTGLGLAQSPTDYILIVEAQASGTDGGSFTLGAWRTRLLNLEVTDTGNHASLASNQVTLAAGTYRYRGFAVAYKVDNHQVRLQNITAGTTHAFGSNSRAAASDDCMTSSLVVGRFTIGAPTVFELQHICSATKATDGFGLAGSFAGAEIYSSIEFQREAN